RASSEGSSAPSLAHRDKRARSGPSERNTASKPRQPKTRELTGASACSDRVAAPLTFADSVQQCWSLSASVPSKARKEEWRGAEHRRRAASEARSARRWVEVRSRNYLRRRGGP